MKKLLISIIALLTIEQCFAQQSKHKIKFSSINSIGTVMGENGSSTTLQTINGIKINKWALGLGISHDPYQVTSIPAYIDVRKYWGKKNWQPFGYIDGGLNINLHNNNYPKEYYTFKNSTYYDLGIGISSSISKTAKFFISAGYSVKQFNYNWRYWIWDTGFPSASSQYNFNFRRWSIKLGLEL